MNQVRNILVLSCMAASINYNTQGFIRQAERCTQYIHSEHIAKSTEVN